MDYIDVEPILDASQQGLTIFQYYFPGVDFHDKKSFVKCRSNERTASAKVSLYQGKWHITDFGNQSEINGMTAISYVMHSENLIFNDALHFIEKVIIKHEVGSRAFRRPEYKAEYSWRDVEPEDKKDEYKFTYKPSPTDNDLKSIGRYVTVELLERFNFKSVEKYEMVGYSEKFRKDIVHIFKSTDDYPIFLLDEGSFKKIIKPHELEKRYRFHYIGRKPNNYVFGLKQLKELDNEFVNPETGKYEYNGPEWKKPRVKELIRCSGESDAMNLASLGFHVYWLNSETAEMDRDTWNELDGMCVTHNQLMDIDATGKEMAMKFADQHIDLITIQLPEWLKLKKDWRGNACKDIKDFIGICGSNQDETLREVQVLKRKAFPMRFWTKITKGQKGKDVVSQSIDLENFYYFLQSHGFYVIDSVYHQKAGYCFAHITDKIVVLINPMHIKKIVKRFTREWIRSQNLFDENAILNMINSSNKISENNLQELQQINLEFTNHDSKTEYLHFRNGSIRIRMDSIEKIKHQEVPNYILGKLEIGTEVISHVIDKNITLGKQPSIEVNPTPAYATLLDKLNSAKTPQERENINVELENFTILDRFVVKINDEDFIFTRFLQDLSYIHWRKELEKKETLSVNEIKEQNLLLTNIMFMLGYMASQYKNPAKPWLVFLQDIKITPIGQSSGRSGKSVLCKGLSYTRPRFYIDGRRKDITNKTDFIYDGYTRFHNIIEVDDLNEFADFDFFYAQITGNREVNSKHISKQILPFDCSGKMIISSNYELRKVDSSTIARILNTAVSDYYHVKTRFNDYKETRSPKSKFGRLLYDDFTDEDWGKFYNFMAYCIQITMRFDKIQPPMENLEKRQLRRLMTNGGSKNEEFYNWANQYFTISPDPRPELSPCDVGYFNVPFRRDSAFENFKLTLSSSQVNGYTNNQFKSNLIHWCEYHGYELNPLIICTGANAAEDRRIIKKIGDKTIECFYISTAPLHVSENKNDQIAYDINNLPF